MVQCKLCKLSLARVKSDSTMRCNGTCEGVFHKKCAAKIKAFSETGMCDECQISPAVGSPITVDLSRVTPEKILAEVNEKLAIVFNMKKTLESMSNDISFYAEKYQELMEEKEKTDKKIKALEHKNVHLETSNKALEERITYLEIKEKERNVEIIGLEEEGKEKLDNTINVLANKLGMDTKTICEIKRVGEEKRNSAAGEQQRKNKPRPVIVTMTTRNARDQWLATRKTVRLSNNDLFEHGNKDRIYINEDLTKNMRNLFWTAKIELKPLYKYIWTQAGKVLIKKDDPKDTKIRAIRTLSDIDKYANN